MCGAQNSMSGCGSGWSATMRRTSASKSASSYTQLALAGHGAVAFCPTHDAGGLSACAGPVPDHRSVMALV